MSVTNGQPANQDTLNNAFVSKTTDSTMAKNLELDDATAGQGPSIDQVQRELNSLGSFMGKPPNSPSDDTPTWTNNFYGSPTDDIKERVEAHDFAIDDLQSQITAITSLTPLKQTFILSPTDITNQYIDLAQVALTDSIHFMVKGAGSLLEGLLYDYSVDYTGGAGGVTRITFLNDLAGGGASELVSTDVVQVSYLA